MAALLLPIQAFMGGQRNKYLYILNFLALGRNVLGGWGGGGEGIALVETFLSTKT
jgi:hypothetical protein